MTRLYGRAIAGARVVGTVPHGHWQSSTFVCGLRCREIIAPFVIDRPMNADIFLTYVKRSLVPDLKANDVVIMDNLAAHKRPAVAQAIKEAGASVLYLPPYSPDLNPIEMAFAKLKALMRKAEDRTKDALWDRLKSVLDAFSPQDCLAFFKHAGYE